MDGKLVGTDVAILGLFSNIVYTWTTKVQCSVIVVYEHMTKSQCCINVVGRWMTKVHAILTSIKAGVEYVYDMYALQQHSTPASHKSFKTFVSWIISL